MRALIHDIKNIKGSFASKFSCTIKTHKGAGDVKLRALHASPDNMMKPGMRYVAHVLKPILKGLPHILRDSDHLIAMIRGRRFPNTSKIVQFDIKDFFMSGSHNDLASSCARLVSPEVRRGFTKMLQMILRNQYVVLDKSAETAYHTKVGSGMGMLCSGEISDACFYDLAEKEWACNQAVCARHGILFYARFKDDGFFIVDGLPEVWYEFAWEFKRRARFFEVIFDVSHEDFNFLDLTFERRNVDSTQFTFDWVAFRKPTTLWQPLSHTSHHPWHVHLGWPFAVEKRLRGHCKDPTRADSVVSIFTSSLRMRCPRHPFFTGDTRRSFTGKPKSEKASTIVVPFRLAWMLARISSILRANCALIRTAHWSMPQPRLAWKLSDRHLVHKLRSFSGHMAVVQSHCIIR